MLLLKTFFRAPTDSPFVRPFPPLKPPSLGAAAAQTAAKTALRTSVSDSGARRRYELEEFDPECREWTLLYSADTVADQTREAMRLLHAGGYVLFEACPVCFRDLSGDPDQVIGSPYGIFCSTACYLDREVTDAPVWPSPLAHGLLKAGLVAYLVLLVLAVTFVLLGGVR